MSGPVGGGGFRQRLVGRSFVSPAFDYLAIGGGLSLLWFAFLGAEPWVAEVDRNVLMVAIFLANCTHFAASTVRLYTIPGATRTLPGLTMLFPTVALAVLTFCLLDAERIGSHLQFLYLTWSPYHYAAQTYGLAVMYGYRSGCLLQAREKRLLRCVCLLPFLYAFVGGGLGSGVDWLLPSGILDQRWFGVLRTSALQLLQPLIFVAPLALFAWTWRSRSGPGSQTIAGLGRALPDVEDHHDPQILDSVGHGRPQEGLVVAGDHPPRAVRHDDEEADERRWHAAWFYAVSLALAYALFFALPLAYVWAGFGRVESILLVVAAINVHHFVVDAYIWHLGRGGSNRRIVDAGAALPA